MLYFLLFFTTAVGWGGLAQRLTRLSSPSLHLLLGLGLACLTLYLGCDWLQLPVAKMAWVVAAISILGFIFQAVKIERIHEVWLHPIFIFTILSLTLWTIFSHHQYFPYQWDEFSHWWVMPKQIWTFDSIRADGFPFKTFLEYTPGWPLLISYPTFLLPGAFEDHYHIWGPFVIGMAGAGIFWETIQTHSKSRLYSVVVGWIALLVLVRFKIVGTVYPSSLLIEFAQIPVLFAALWSLIQMRRDPVQARSWAISFSILLVFAFLLKKPSIALMLVAPFAISWSRQQWRQNLGQLVVLIGPTLLVAKMWSWKTAALPHLFTLTADRIAVPWHQHLFSPEAADLVKIMMLYAAKELAIYLPLTIVVVWGLVKLWRENGMRRLVFGIAIWLSIYLTSLFWLYLTAFSEVERHDLSGIDRYLSIPCHILFATMAMVTLQKLAPQLEILFARRRQGFYVLLAILSFVVLEQMQANFHNHGAGRPSVFQIEGTALKELIRADHLERPHIWMIAQRYWKDRWREALSQSLERPGKAMFELDPNSWIAPASDTSEGNKGRFSTVDSNGFAVLMNKAQIIWPARLDDWTREELKKQLKDADCPGELEQYFIKRVQDQWVCQMKLAHEPKL